MTIVKTEVPCEGGALEARRSRGRPQARSDEETRAIILDAARKEFSASGYAATNMEAVSRRAGVSTKALYRLIPNKAALFEAMITQRTDRFVAVVRLRACEGRDIEAALREALMACAELILDGEVIALQRMDPRRKRQISRHCPDLLPQGDQADREHAGVLAAGASQAWPYCRR